MDGRALPGLHQRDGMAGPASPLQAEPPPSRGLPGWALALWFAVNAFVGIFCFFILYVATAFGCDSVWDGCVGAAQAVWAGYAVVCGLGLVLPLVWALRSRSSTVRLVAAGIMPLSVVIALIGSILGYAIIADAVNA